LQTLSFAMGTTSLGRVLVATCENGVRAVLFGSDEKSLLVDVQGRNPRTRLARGGDMAEQALAAVVRAIETGDIDTGLVLVPRGTDYQRRVWKASREIPVGATATYKEIAAKVGGTAQEVGEACAANAVAVLIPCHRVVRSDGGLAGYRWGIHRKRAIIEREQEIAPPADSLFSRLTTKKQNAPEQPFH
jgi:AraC family transcriptional regulator of adaptative response/methylated-DNA-[protein]-cysteine methyltransferase